MRWWQQLRHNPLARWGVWLLAVLYAVVIFGDLVAPYDPYGTQINGSLLPPTTVYWRSPSNGQWLGPHVYPTTLGPTSLETGDRPLARDFSQPSPLRLWVKGDPYQWLRLEVPAIGNDRPWVVFPGIAGDRHLFGTIGPGKLNLLGTDEQGRDQLSRLIYGGRISLFIGIVGILISFPLGMLVGGIAGYFGGWVDAILMRLVEVLMTIPTIYLLVSLTVVLPANLTSAQRFLLIVMITSLVSWSGLARIVRGQVLSLKTQDFVLAAQAMGRSSGAIIVRHILPQTATYILISATLSIPGFIVAESVLSLIGLGIQQPDPSWGNLLSSATNASTLVLEPWLVWPPALLLILTVLAFNLLGDGLRDVLDPRGDRPI